MASRSSTAAALALLLSLGLLSSALLVSGSCPPSPKKTKPTPSPRPRPTPSPRRAYCPVDTLKLSGCANVLGSLPSILIGTPPKTPCCTLIEGLADLEAAACLCTAIKANVLGVNLNLDVNLTLLLNYCGKTVPYGYLCA